MISIIISFRDYVDLLKQCVLSIQEKSTCKNYEIILVNNQSVKRKTFEYLETLQDNPQISILQYEKPFNFSAINNFAVKQAKGEYVLFLNNDTEVIAENWLEAILEEASKPKVGAVGAKLLYPDGTIQHAGIKVGKNIATHQFSRMRESDLKEKNIIREVDAVTGACLMTRKDLFLELGGFDEKNLPIAYNDVDYCLRLKERGFKIICILRAKLFHHESASRKSDIVFFAKIFRRKRYRQFQNEQVYMRKRWKL